MVSDPDWNGKAVKGQENFVDIEKGTVHVCHEITYLEGGKIVDA
jgi:hypothetical protein